MNELDMVNELDDLIDEFITRSEIFVRYSCYLPGLKDLIDNEESIRQVYDHEYLAFTKSTKTLISIKHLLELGNNEDVYILNRSIFENYLAARYLNENVHSIADIPKLEEYIQNRIKVTLGYYSIYKSFVVDEKGEKVARVKPINSQLVGLDKLYYYEFYAFLSRFTHLDFSMLHYYIDDHAFAIYKESDVLLSRLVTVFIITKLFESIVTIEGEDFLDKDEEQKCYNLVETSLMTQRKIFNVYIDNLNKLLDDRANKYLERLQNMLIKMNMSLEDNIGDLNKTKLFSAHN